MAAPRFNPGFRLSMLDGAVVVVAVVAALAMYDIDRRASFCISFVVCHFFLFCNVFRMPRPLELTWAAVFLVLAITTLILGFPGWPLTIVLSLLTTVTVIAIQVRRPSYHGIAWQRLNPGLPDWFQAHYGESAKARQDEG